MITPKGGIYTRPCAGNLLADARRASGFHQYQVSQMLSDNKHLCPGKDDFISPDTVSNWECNRAMPDLEQVAALEKLYDCPGLWIKWIRLQWPSAMERIPENPQMANACIAVVNAGYQAADMKTLTDALVRDLIGGKCDDLELKAKYLKEAKENVAAHNAAIAMLESEGD